jgi:hypothetical protein
VKLTTNTLVAAFCAVAAGCASQPQYGIQSYTAQKPMYERHTEISKGRYYIEILGNGFASHKMLEEHFGLKARELCRDASYSAESERTTRLRGGELQDIKMDCRVMCNGDAARFPLVRGVVKCNKAV